MPTILETVTEYEDKALELLTQLQAQVLEVVKKAVDALDDRLPELPEVPYLDQLPTLSQVVDTQFAFSKKLLANNEKFAKNLVKTVKPLTRDAAPAKPAATKAA